MDLFLKASIIYTVAMDHAAQHGLIEDWLFFSVF